MYCIIVLYYTLVSKVLFWSHLDPGKYNILRVSLDFAPWTPAKALPRIAGRLSAPQTPKVTANRAFGMIG